MNDHIETSSSEKLSEISQSALSLLQLGRAPTSSQLSVSTDTDPDTYSKYMCEELKRKFNIVRPPLP